MESGSGVELWKFGPVAEYLMREFRRPPYEWHQQPRHDLRADEFCLSMHGQVAHVLRVHRSWFDFYDAEWRFRCALNQERVAERLRAAGREPVELRYDLKPRPAWRIPADRPGPDGRFRPAPGVAGIPAVMTFLSRAFPDCSVIPIAKEQERIHYFFLMRDHGLWRRLGVTDEALSTPDIVPGRLDAALVKQITRAITGLVIVSAAGPGLRVEQD
jgi:hypothetical protein